MIIEFNHVVPAALREREHLNSEIWGARVAFESPGFYQLWAPSGRGKTTFTHMLYGLRRDYTGWLSFDGKKADEIKSDEWAALRQSHLSIVFQDLRLFPHLTAWDNIRIKHGLQPFHSEAELRELCHELSIDKLLNTCCDQISFGEQQRVAIVRAMAQPFEWLLLDEPFSHLDADNASKVCQLISRQCQLRRAGCLLMTLDLTRHFEHSHPLRL